MSRVNSIIHSIHYRQLKNSQDRLLERFLHDREFARRMSVHPFHSCMGQWLPPREGDTVLELGCGPGKYVAMLSTLGYRVTGVDPYSFPTWEILRHETSATLMEKVLAEQLPFPDHSFDHVVSIAALLYFKEPLKALEEVRRVLKPGGRLVLCTVNRKNLYTQRTGRRPDPASHQLFSMEELTALMEAAGLLPSRSFTYGFWLPFWSNFWWYLQCVWIPLPLLDFLSARLKPENGFFITVLASSPEAGT